MPSLKMHQEFEAPAALQGAVKCFWYNAIDFGEYQDGFEVVPDGYAEIIFYFGSSCNISKGGVLQPLPSPFMMGLLNKPVTFFAENLFEIVGIRCYPWAVFDLLGLPSAKGGVSTFEHPVAQLQPVLAEHINAGAIDKAIALVKQYFLDAGMQAATGSMLNKAGAAMTGANGTLPVSQVAAAAHATVRTLERKFRQSSGYTVKDVNGLMRFEQVRNQLWLNPDANLAGLAHESGYTDQSHLSREFKKYSGTTPAAFARNAKHGQQAVPYDFVSLKELRKDA